MTIPVQRVDYGSVKLSGTYNPPSFQDTRIPVFGYLIRVPTKTILVDTGAGQDHDYVNKVFAPELNSIDAALGVHGITVAEIDCIVNSHLHFDHCGQNRAFADIPHYVQQAEVAALAIENYTIKDWPVPDAFRIVDGDVEVCPGITLLSSPGHTPGHQSVLVEAGGIKHLIAAQAAFSFDEFHRGGDPEVQAHEGLEQAYVDSLHRLRGLCADRIYLSHDIRER